MGPTERVEELIQTHIRASRVQPTDAPPDLARCLLVQEVAPVSPAAELGIVRGDVLVSVDGEPAGARRFPDVHVDFALERRYVFHSPARKETREIEASGIDLGVALGRTPAAIRARATHDEIERQRDRIELLRATESSFQAERGIQKAASTSFERVAAEAITHKETLLRAFDLRFAGDADGQRRLSAIRAGEGDADLVQDVSDLLLRCKEERGYLADCPRGEAEAASRLRVLSPELSELLAAKGMSAASIEARKLRDRAYTLMMITEKRLRTAADYWYRGTDKLRDDAGFSAQVRGAGSGGNDAPTDGAAEAGAESPTAVSRSGGGAP